MVVPLLDQVVHYRLQERNTMLQAMVDSPEEAEGWDAPQAGRPSGAGGTMTSSSLHRILQVTVFVLWHQKNQHPVGFATCAI